MRKTHFSRKFENDPIALVRKTTVSFGKLST